MVLNILKKNYVCQPKHVVHVESNKNNRGYSIGSTTIDRKQRNLRPKKMVDYLDPIVFKAKRKDIHTYKKYMLENVELCLKYK
jgi:23S rRNA maturation-related 3'-5' exoribonuclease YhaM